jgi:hypothetical protein
VRVTEGERQPRIEDKDDDDDENDDDAGREPQTGPDEASDCGNCRGAAGGRRHGPAENPLDVTTLGAVAQASGGVLAEMDRAIVSRCHNETRCIREEREAFWSMMSDFTDDRNAPIPLDCVMAGQDPVFGPYGHDWRAVRRCFDQERAGR